MTPWLNVTVDVVMLADAFRFQTTYDPQFDVCVGWLITSIGTAIVELTLPIDIQICVGTGTYSLSCT